jgi:hypothetical protein
MIVLDIQLPVQGVFDAGLAAGLWFSPGTTISSTNKTDSHDIIMLDSDWLIAVIFFLQIQVLHCEFADFLLHVGVFA